MNCSLLDPWVGQSSPALLQRSQALSCGWGKDSNLAKSPRSLPNEPSCPSVVNTDANIYWTTVLWGLERINREEDLILGKEQKFIGYPYHFSIIWKQWRLLSVELLKCFLIPELAQTYNFHAWCKDVSCHMGSLGYPFTRSQQPFYLLTFSEGKGPTPAWKAPHTEILRPQRVLNCSNPGPNLKLPNNFISNVFGLWRCSFAPTWTPTPTPPPQKKERGKKYLTIEKMPNVSDLQQKRFCGCFSTSLLTGPMGPGCNRYGFCAEKWEQPQNTYRRSLGPAQMPEALREGTSERTFERGWNRWKICEEARNLHPHFC